MSAHTPTLLPIHTELSSDLATLESTWRELLAKRAHPNAFLSWEWLSCWWEYYGANHPQVTPYFLTLSTSDDKVIGILPLYHWRSDRSDSRSEFRLAGNFGWEGGATEEPIFLAAHGYELAVFEAALDFIKKGTHRQHWDIATLSWQVLQPTKAIKPRRFLGQLLIDEGRQVILLPRSWATYRKSLSKSMRSNLAYYPHRLEKAGVQVAFQFITSPEEMSGAVDHLVRLHHHRATSSRGPRHVNHLAGERNIAFTRECLTRLAGTAQACIALMRINDEVIAAQAYVFYEDEFTLYYSGFDTAWYDYSPLTVLIGEIIKYAITQKVARLNFLSHPAPFRLRWGTQTETLLYAAYLIHGHPRALLNVAKERLLKGFSKK